MPANIFYMLYSIKIARWRNLILRIVSRLERGQMYSKTLRRIYSDYHEIAIGMYSYGGCFNLRNIREKTKIGRYCSIASGVCVFNRNHPIGYRSTHPFFYNVELGFIESETITKRTLIIDNDVWVGRNAMIMPSVERIGDGAVVAAGAIVTKDVPDFAVVVGIPARIIRYRFSQQQQDEVKRSQWWNKDIKDLSGMIHEFRQPLEGDEISLSKTSGYELEDEAEPETECSDE